MNPPGRSEEGRWPAWRQGVSALPVGIGAAAFLAIRWPWDLLVIVALLGYAWGLVVLPGRRACGGVLSQVLLAFGCIFIALIAAVGGYLAGNVPQAWLPVPVLVGLAVLAVVQGVIFVWRPGLR